MYKSLVLIAITIYLKGFSYAQNNIDMMNDLKIEQDIISLENRITDLIKKNPKIANIQGLKQYHILLLSPKYGNFNKENYLDYSFLYQLSYGYYSLFGKQKYIVTETLVTDSIGNLIATGDAILVHVAPVFAKSDMEVSRMFFNKEFDFVFCLASPHSMGYMVGIKDNNLYALEDTKEGIKIYTWEEFIECCFDKWINRK